MLRKIYKMANLRVKWEVGGSGIKEACILSFKKQLMRKSF